MNDLRTTSATWPTRSWTLKEKFMDAVIDALGSNFRAPVGRVRAFQALSDMCGGDPEGAIGGITRIRSAR